MPPPAAPAAPGLTDGRLWRSICAQKSESPGQGPRRAERRVKRPGISRDLGPDWLRPEGGVTCGSRRTEDPVGSVTKAPELCPEKEEKGETNSMREALYAAAGAFVLTLLIGRFLIPELRKLKAGQEIREDGPTWHQSKAGTPPSVF